MEVTKKIIVQARPHAAFKSFVHNLNAWWPKEYTWSGDTLVEIRIDRGYFKSCYAAPCINFPHGIGSGADCANAEH